MPFAYFQRLSPADQRTYRRSDEIAAVRLPEASTLHARVASLMQALASEDRGRTEVESRVLAQAINEQLRVPPVRLRVYAVRPSWSGGELHGQYTPAEGSRRASVELWMRTAQRRRVVAFRTFMRTLLHELCHHLDYELFELPESFHTEGFFKRESSLFHQLVTSSGIG